MTWINPPLDAVFTDEEILANRRKWTDALRSGAYLQGSGKLVAPALSPGGRDSFCCLGVACEALEIPRRGGGYDILRSSGVEGATMGYAPGAMSVSLSLSVRKALGIGNADQSTLIRMNDGITEAPGPMARKSFQEIADYIDNLPIYRGDNP